MVGKTLPFWKVRDTPCSAMSVAGRPVTVRPLRLIWPESGLRKPQIRLMVVDFPDPLGPIMPITWPDARSMLTSATACSPWKLLLRSRTLSRG